jgi:hypothetical protein
MPLKITPSKKPLPVAKRSSLRKKSYEVDPIRGPKIYPSRGLTEPIRYLFRKIPSKTEVYQGNSWYVAVRSSRGVKNIKDDTKLLSMLFRSQISWEALFVGRNLEWLLSSFFEVRYR